MHNLTCAACGRALAETSAWKGIGERFYCNDFCAEAEETDILDHTPSSQAVPQSLGGSGLPYPEGNWLFRCVA